MRASYHVVSKPADSEAVTAIGMVVSKREMLIRRILLWKCIYCDCCFRGQCLAHI